MNEAREIAKNIQPHYLQWLEKENRHNSANTAREFVAQQMSKDESYTVMDNVTLALVMINAPHISRDTAITLLKSGTTCKLYFDKGE